MNKDKIILFGGTFDPIHRGHIEVALAAREHFDADTLLFIPASRSPLKKQQPVASDQNRVKMIRLSIGQNDRLRLSECELNRPQPSYTLDTVIYFREKYAQADLIWLVGADVVKDLSRWYKMGDLMEACTISVMYRAGYPKPDFKVCKDKFTPEQIAQFEQNIVPVPLIEISSTDIRARISQGRDVGDFLSPKVYDYIKKHDLYK